MGKKKNSQIHTHTLDSVIFKLVMLLTKLKTNTHTKSRYFEVRVYKKKRVYVCACVCLMITAQFTTDTDRTKDSSLKGFFFSGQRCQPWPGLVVLVCLCVYVYLYIIFRYTYSVLVSFRLVWFGFFFGCCNGGPVLCASTYTSFYYTYNTYYYIE